MKKIAIIGSNGLLGYALSRFLSLKSCNFLAITRKEFDIAKDPFEKFQNLVGDCDYIVNCAGIIKPLISQTSLEEVIMVNTVFPHNLALLCKRNIIRCIHITTDCVFSGLRGNYNENDYYDAQDLYGLSKIGGDSIEIMTLRTSMVGEEKGRMRSLLEWAKSQKGKQVYGYMNHFWNGLTTPYLSNIIYIIIKEGLYSPRIFHIHSSNIISKYELLILFNETYDLNLTIKPIDAPVYCNRSLSSIHDLSSKLVKKTIHEQIRELKSFFS